MGIKKTSEEGDLYYQTIKKIIDPIVDNSDISDKEILKENITKAVSLNFEQIELAHENKPNIIDKPVLMLKENDEIENSKLKELLKTTKPDFKQDEKNLKDLGEISIEIVETVEEYSDLLKEFGDIKVEELFKSDPYIEEIAKAYMENKAETELFEELANNPGALAGFLLGMQLISDQIAEENKKLLDVFEGLDVEGLLEENPRIEKIARYYRGETTKIEKFLDIAKDLIRAGAKFGIENFVSKSKQAGLISSICLVQALRQGKYKLAAAHGVGIASIMFCSYYDDLFKDATLKVLPDSEIAFEGMKIEKKLKKWSDSKNE